MMAPYSWLVLAVLALDSTALGSAPGVCHCCQALTEADGLKGKIYLPHSTAYDARLDSYWSLSAALPPWCMVQPASTEDVATTIKTLTANKCPFGIRAGGHGSFPLSNSVKRGVTIDFGLMNTTTWDPKTKIASIQPGTDWQRVYEALAPKGVVVPGGRVSTVGIAGYVTGGGLSFQQASHGLACDNVANFEVVLANGTVANANAESNADLWQALKGGSGNFGLVTRFDMYGIEYKDPSKPVMWGGNLAFDVRSAPAMADAMVEFTDNVHKDENSSVILAWTYSPQTASETIINAAVYNTEARAKAPAFQPFYSVKRMYNDTARVTDMTELTAELGFGQVAGYHYIWFDSAFRNDPRVIKFASRRFAQLNKDLERLAPSAQSQLNTNMFLQPLSKSMADKGVKNGGNSVGLNQFTDMHNGILFLVTTAVKDAKSEQLVLPRVSAFVDEVEGYAKSLGLYWEWKYLNYARGSQDAIASYGETSMAKLCATATKYDPDSVFQKLRGSGFKLHCEEAYTEL